MPIAHSLPRSKPYSKQFLYKKAVICLSKEQSAMQSEQNLSSKKYRTPLSGGFMRFGIAINNFK